jgi:hypothetical protein
MDIRVLTCVEVGNEPRLWVAREIVKGITAHHHHIYFSVGAA